MTVKRRVRASRGCGTNSVPPTAMGRATRASGQLNSEPAKTASPRPLDPKSPRPKRADLTGENAPVIEFPVQLIQSAWEEPVVAPACPTWVDSASMSTQYSEYLKTMKPLGQYPSPAEYKSVGLTPPSRQVLKEGLLASRAEIDDADFLSITPVTPVAEEAIFPKTTSIGEDVGRQNTQSLEGSVGREDGGNGDVPKSNRGINPVLGVTAASALNGGVNGTVNETVNRSLNPNPDCNLDRSLHTSHKGSILEPSLDSLLDISPATPVSNAVDLTAQSSLSPAETPVGEIISHLTFPSFTSLPSLPQHPGTPPVTAVVDGMASHPEKATGTDFLAVLETLPSPASATYDVGQLKAVVESAIRNSSSRGEHDVALSLVHYWSRANGDDFKLSLIHNLGREETDHNLELALRTMLRGSIEDASEWLKTTFSSSHVDSGSDSSLSSVKSVGAQPSSRTSFKVADIYRDTSGPKLEEAFLNGKTNTAPLKRPKKPCPANEIPYKRRLEREADPDMEENLRNKRVCLSEKIAVEPPEAQESSIRPAISESDGDDDDMDIDMPDVEPVSDNYPSGSKAPRVIRSSEEHEAERLMWREQWRFKVAHQKKVNPRSRATVLKIDWDPQTSDSAYSDDENTWLSNYDHRLDPKSMYVVHDHSGEDIDANLKYSEPPENLDNCAICDGSGELLCCDTCEYAFHFKCLKPPMDPKKPPEGRWFCPQCAIQICFTEAIRKGEFGTRKTEYTPPKAIKEYFVGVGQVKDRGSWIYKDIPHVPRLTKPLRGKANLVTPLLNDPSLLKLSENGQLIYCAKCGETSLQVRPMIRCDYCTCRWHLDCLDPPRTIPPVPSCPYGWMCPNHVRPTEMIVSKVVEGRLQKRRVRRPKNTVSSVDIDILASDDPGETSFDDDWREKRFHLPVGDVVMSFVSAVHENNRRREHDYFERIQKTAVNVARQLTLEHFSTAPNATSSQAIPASLEQNINTAIQNIKSGEIPNEQYDAASALLGLSQGQSNIVPDDQTATDSPQPSSATDPKPDETAVAEASEKDLS